MFKEQYATSRDTNFADLKLRWAPDERHREAELKAFLCCPEDHSGKWNCKAEQTLCSSCELPVCMECQLCLQKNQLSSMALLNDNFIGFLDPWVYESDITWMENCGDSILDGHDYFLHRPQSYASASETHSTRYHVCGGGSGPI